MLHVLSIDDKFAAGQYDWPRSTAAVYSLLTHVFFFLLLVFYGSPGPWAAAFFSLLPPKSFPNILMFGVLFFKEIDG